MTIKERHNQLDATIGFLESEMESLERAQLFAWVFFPTWIFMAILQAISFMLYNGRFHPLAKILDGCNIEESNDIMEGDNLTKHTFTVLGTFHFFFSDCYIEKSWPVNQSVLGVKEQTQSEIILKNIGKKETAELEQNSINLNDCKYDFDHATSTKTQFKE